MTPNTVLTPPKQAYILMTGSGADYIGLLLAGERYVRETKLPTPCFYDQATVDDLNATLGVTPGEALAMKLCAIDGTWDNYSKLAGGK